MKTQPVILFEDTHLVVLDKPAGLLSQGDSGGEPSLVDWLRDYFGRNYVGLVHRLDRNTSGVMVAAKRTKAARRLTSALQEGKLERLYQAFLVGELRGAQTWKHRLVKDEEKNEVRLAGPGARTGKEAVLSVRPLGYGERRGVKLTLAEFRLETGRSHQIRVQAAAENFPVLGDVKYGRFIHEPWNRQFGRPALHSSKIIFPHPMSNEVMSFSLPLPPDMAGIAVTAAG